MAWTSIVVQNLRVCVITDAGLMLARGRRASLANTHLAALLFYMDGVLST